MASLPLYYPVRDRIQTGDMLEWRSGGIIGPVIRLFTGKDRNHTSMCVALGDHVQFLKPHKYIMEANFPGLELELISRRLEDYGGQVWWSHLKGGTPEMRDRMEKWALLQVGVKYDFGGLLWNAVARVSANARRLFCSEAYYIALVVGGFIPHLHYDEKSKRVIDERGYGVHAPRPGEFEWYELHDPPVRIC